MLRIKPEDQFRVKGYLRTYLVLTLAIVVYIAVVSVLYGAEGMGTIIKIAPMSIPVMTLFYGIVAWLLFGSMLALANRQVINKQNVLIYTLFFLFSFIYLNFLREKVVFGDVFDYVRAASNLYHDQPLHSRYLYPPFFATCLQSLVPLGDKTIAFVCMGANYLSLLVFFVLVYKLLRRFGLSGNHAALIAFAALCVNVPVLRTLGYVQVNLHVVNLILLNLLFYRKRVFWSAIALGLAVHLKFSPIVLVLPYCLSRDWKWLAYFCGSVLAIAAWTSWMNSPDYYMDFLKNALNILQHNKEHIFGPEGFAYRDSSLDGLARAIMSFTRTESGADIYFGLIARFCLLLFSGYIVLGNLKWRTYYGGDKKEEIVFNSYVVMLFLMTMLSPVVWVYHFVFVIPAFLIMLRNVRDHGDITLFLVAWFLIYLMPSFDVFPVSYHRLIGVVMAYVLFTRFLKRGDKAGEPYPWITNMLRKGGSLLGNNTK